MGPEREFAGHQDPVAPLKHVCRAWKPQGGPAVPQTLERGTGSEACHSGGRGSCRRRCKRAGRSCHLGSQQPPRKRPQHQGAASLCLLPTPSTLLLCHALGDPPPRAAATLPPRGTAPMLGAQRGTEPIKAPPHRRWARHEARGKAQA